MIGGKGDRLIWVYFTYLQFLTARYVSKKSFIAEVQESAVNCEELSSDVVTIRYIK